jgi:hypothetical protein
MFPAKYDLGFTGLYFIARPRFLSVFLAVGRTSKEAGTQGGIVDECTRQLYRHAAANIGNTHSAFSINSEGLYDAVIRVMRQLIGGRAVKRGAASASAMGRFETATLTQAENLAALAEL